MKELLLRTTHLLRDDLEKEFLSIFPKIKTYKINQELCIQVEESLFSEVFSELYYSCKNLERIFLKVPSSSNFDIKITENKEEFCYIDLIGFSMFEYDFIYLDETFLPMEVVLKLYNKLEIKDSSLSMIDPHANNGVFFISVVSIVNKFPVLSKKRLSTVYTSLFKPLSFPNKESNIKVKATAIVQEDMNFKRFKQNLAYFPMKIKVSKFDFDWLDVKFKDSDFTYLISVIDYDDQEKIEQFFYQASFITEKKIGVISLNELKKRAYSKHNLFVENNLKVIVNNNTYYIYTFLKNKI